MDRKLARLLDMRQGEENDSAKAEQSFADRFTEGAPELPRAQLVYSPNGPIGVAVEGAKFVCPLPGKYRGPNVSLSLIDRGRYVVTHPDLPPLVINPEAGTTSLL